ncbi:MAG: hypothetical protein A3G49_05490 [Candidatus Sungbacteria bacterium RIFCSPLOWO2_12_FULL_41_11]|uniref:Uncharacterized protein n=1 Tax=Candidatus Sungbacteria bacterium RIFCSPLOWO2_12_FULL_41_11 TaxID=1802286 RepID=A0A1G2LSJ3_9BACT|nr:MAG: hypothetical protein A3G49_05490 [Candidatus Sungbacteria bacterium RIFCSPLOWO2_12_FULL_41_11]
MESVRGLTAASLHFLGPFEGLEESGGGQPLGLALGVTLERLGKPKRPDAVPTADGGIPTADDHALSTRDLRVKIPHLLGLGREPAGLNGANELFHYPVPFCARFNAALFVVIKNWSPHHN